MIEVCQSPRLSSDRRDRTPFSYPEDGRPLKLSEIPNIDRTALGQQQYAEEELRRPARDAVLRAQREEEIARRHKEQLPAIFRKWVRKSHHEIEARLSQYEAKFQKP